MPRDAAPRDPNAPRRQKPPRKPIGPDATGLGPDGSPWDPERRAKTLAEREARKAEHGAVNAAPPVAVEATAAPSDTSAEQK
jgi:hypothetical protein